MPEGDTIFRAAAGVRKALNGRCLVTATGRREVGAESLTGSTVTGVESRGKHLLIHFDNQLVLHSHLGMTGAWHIYPVDHEWQKPRQQACVQLTTHRHDVVCFTPDLLEVVSEQRIRRNPYLNRLGPDLLGPPIADEVFLSRMRTQRRIPIGQAVMNQTVVCGIGNVYKSEILFLERLHPLTPVRHIDDESLLSLRDRSRLLMGRNLENGPRRTRFRPDEQFLWVYGRRGDSCLKCGTTVQMIRQGDLARSTYYCPACQQAAAEESVAPAGKNAG